MAKEGSGQHVHGWENITLLEEEAVLENKLIAQTFYSPFFIVIGQNDQVKTEIRST